MDTQQDFTNESFALLPSVLAGVAVAIVLAPKNDFFFGNFMFYWIPQAIVLGILISFTSRPAVVSGVAVILALYLAAYGAWLFFTTTDDAGLAWLGYLFSLPGAAIGAIAGALFIKQRNYQRAMIVGAIAAVSSLVGLVLNQLLICSTVMYCGF
jgi:hypothetical protein